MAAARKTNRRIGLRAYFTTIVKNIEECLDDEAIDQAKLSGLKKTLLGTVEQLAQADDDVSKSLEPEDIENDVIESLKFVEPANQLEAAIDLKLAQLNIVKVPLASSVTPSSVSNVCRLPKIDLPVFEGNPLKWQGFWDQFQVSVHDNERISDIDRFNFLKKYLKGEALSAVSGLNLSADNYKEAIALLKDRYGNEQVLISAHMKSLLKINKIRNKDNIKGLRDLYNHIESCVRNLRSLKLEPKGYGSLLIPILTERLPDDLVIIISRKFGSAIWTLDRVLEYFNEELRAQENCFSNANSEMKPKPSNYTTSGFHIQSGNISCVYCGKEGHMSARCRSITNVASRKGILRKDRRCFLCLEEGHNARECSSKYVCRKCKRGKHHISICEEKTSEAITAFSFEHRETNFNGERGILMQTAKARIFAADSDDADCLSRFLFDTGSQRSYVSVNVRNKLKLKTIRTERVIIKTFGDDNNSKVSNLDVVQFKVRHVKENVFTYVEALVVPRICSQLKGQYIDKASKLEEFKHLTIADSNSPVTDLPVGILIGIDHYHRFFSGKTIQSKCGIVASESTLGWVLSGSIPNKNSSDLTCMDTINMRCSVEQPPVSDSLDVLREDLSKFWSVEDIGSVECVVNQFKHDIYHDDRRYVSKLPFKSDHDYLPDNYDVCVKRLNSLKGRLKRQGILNDYDKIFKEYETNGIIERVPLNDLCKENGQAHYLPHRPVIREDKETTKIRSVFDASCKVNGPSLNDCLYSGPNLLLKIFDVLLRFRFNRIGVLADIKQAFLHVGIAREHMDYLRFLWFDSSTDYESIIVFRFSRAVFGVTCSPFLLNATIRHHLNKFLGSESKGIVEKVLKDLYVDDLISGCNSVEEGKVFYKQTKDLMSGADFDLRKWVTSNKELGDFIKSQEGTLKKKKSDEDDVTYCDVMLPQSDRNTTVLGLRWDTNSDEIVFDFHDLLEKCRTMKKTKRGLLSVVASVFDPMGVVSPVTSRIKTIFQLLCNDKLDWDDSIPERILNIVDTFLVELKNLGEIRIPRYICPGSNNDLIEIHGFADSSKEVYCAVLYLRVVSNGSVKIDFLASKTRVAPLKKLSIPRLELLGCLLLTKLLNEVLNGLKNKVKISNVVCWSDSQVSLAWIKGKEKRWKPWVENRVVSIRKVVGRENWRFVKGELNPADVPTRLAKGLGDCFASFWISGPEFLLDTSFDEFVAESECPEEDVLFESKKSYGGTVALQSLTVTNDKQNNCGLSEIIDLCKFSSLRKVLIVTGYVIRFVANLKKKASKQQLTNDELTAAEYQHALDEWIKEDQRMLRQQPNFSKLNSSLKLFNSANEILRLKGRFGNSTMTKDEQFPIILRDGDHDFTKLVILDAHEQCLHHGIETTLTFVRRKYWIVKGRKSIKKLLRKCVTCKRHQGLTLRPPPTPDLPDFRVDSHVRAFYTTGLDYAGPLYIRNCKCNTNKIYILLFTCATCRAVHLELVPDMSTPTFIRAFRRFIARRGVPNTIINDNFKTFRSKEVKHYMTTTGVSQCFILPASPWWGGFYERLVRSVKTTLKKTIGKAFLSFEELQTALCDVELSINSRPLTYQNEDDLDTALTPTHLIFGTDIHNIYQPEREAAILKYEDYSKRAKHIQLTLEHFRKRFATVYLNELRQTNLYRKGKATDNSKLVLGDIVLIKDDKPCPRSQWRMGKIVNLIKGKDGHIRGAKLKTTSKQKRNTYVTRPSQKLIPFEIVDTPDPDTSDPGTPDPDTSDPDTSKSTEPEPPKNLHDKRHCKIRNVRKAKIEGQNLRRLRDEIYK